jgi:uncharacterized protein (TIGR02301 family)
VIRRVTIRLMAAALLAFGPGAALAQDRTPAQRQTLTDLAYVIGQSHGLRQACEGPSDQMWRSWMSRLLETEAPDAAFDRRLRDSFNTGFYAAQARFADCNDANRAEALRVAERGRALSRQAGVR